jgi:hypothetical protein
MAEKVKSLSSKNSELQEQVFAAKNESAELKALNDKVTREYSKLAEEKSQLQELFDQKNMEFQQRGIM